MPHPVAGAGPFYAALADCPRARVWIIELHIAPGEHGDRADAGMGMHRHIHQSAFGLEQVEKDEWLHHLSEVRRTHQPGDRPMATSARAMGDPALRPD